MTNRRNRTSNNSYVIEKATKVEKEIGVPGISISMGEVREDTIAILRGPKKIKFLEEMTNYDPIVGAFNNMIKSQAESVDWLINSADKENEDANNISDFIKSILFEDISSGSFSELISNALTKLVYGFSIVEPVYKKRDGYKKDRYKSSKFNDGKIGISKFASRYQGSIDKWIFDDMNRQITGVIQKDPNAFNEIPLDYDRILHFKHNSLNNNPQGKSLYVNCAVPYHRKKNTEKSQDQRYDRGFAGIYGISMPAPVLDPNTSNASYLATQKWAKETGLNISAGRNQAVIKPDYITTEVKGANNNSEEAVSIIADCDRKIAVALLSDFFLITQKSGNSGALGQSKIKVFKTLVNSVLDEIKEELNNKLIYNLMIKNSLDLALAPRLKHTEVEDLDLTNLMLFIQSAGKTNLIVPDIQTVNYLKKKVMGKDAPETTEEDYKLHIMRSELISNDSIDKNNEVSLDEYKEQIT